jgi:hypothetical protein
MSNTRFVLLRQLWLIDIYFARRRVVLVENLRFRSFPLLIAENR